MQRKTSNTEQRLDSLTDMVENPLCDLDSEHSDKGRNANLEANPVNSGANSRLGDNSQEQEILELPSYGPVETELTSFSSEISELLSFKEDLSPLKPKEAELLREPLKLMGCSHMPFDEHQNQVEALQSDIPSVDSKPKKLEDYHNWVYDPGGAFPLLASGPTLMSSGVEPTIEAEVVD